MALRVLLVDNFDSYTFNLYQRLAAVSLPAVPAASASSSSGDVSDSHEVTVAATEPEDVPVSMPAPFFCDTLRCAIDSGWVGVEGWRRAGSGGACSCLHHCHVVLVISLKLVRGLAAVS